MLDVKLLRENLSSVQKEIARRGIELSLGEFENLDRRRREYLKEVEELRHQKKTISEQIGKLVRDGEKVVEGKKEQVHSLDEKIKSLEVDLKEVEDSLNNFLLTIPNIPHSSVATGKGEEDNPEVKRWGKLPEFSFKAKNHWEIGQELDILDFERGTKIAGSGFTLYKGLGARMEMALISFMLELHTREHKYLEVLPPFIVNRDSMIGTGQLPKFEEDLYKIEEQSYYLIPTAEVPVTNIHRDEILERAELPKYYVSYTPCFRREAGAHGKDTRGIIRQHQFNKVELVKFTAPDDSYRELETLLEDAEDVLKRLELSYRVVSLCSGDLGFSAAKTYDIEAWLPGQNAFREISSCSNFEDFQARRAGIRYREKTKDKPRFVHTLNGSGLAIGRTVVAILENYQQEDGSVIIPPALRPYMGGVERINKQ
ncbi:MAG: serine--tRNA ligase [Deltaproteobacteria bacterium]|nr:MAG: serine--tRNA ligase [Deltaproteobacteria bacterium]